jgi:hypothetical protein
MFGLVQEVPQKEAPPFYRIRMPETHGPSGSAYGYYQEYEFNQKI